MEFFTSPADIVIYGGAAGGGKTWALLYEPFRHIFDVPGYNFIICRRTHANLTKMGAIVDASRKMYSEIRGARFNKSRLIWSMPPHGNEIGFGSCQYEEDKVKWKGPEYCAMGFDELTEFSEEIFTYLMSRNRSTCGVKPYIRATTNPNANSWVKKWVDPWVTSDFPVRAKTGKLLYFRRFHADNPIPKEVQPFVLYRDGAMVWVKKGCPMAKSITYIPASVLDNQVLMDADPDYIANLQALDDVERRRLLLGDWHATRGGGQMMSRDDFPVVESLPHMGAFVRAWDLAGTEDPKKQRARKRKNQDPDWTVGLLLGRANRNQYYVIDVVRFRGNEAVIEKRIRQTAIQDKQLMGRQVVQYIEMEQGASGKNYVNSMRRRLEKDVKIIGRQVSGSKLTRAKPFVVDAKEGRVFLASDARKGHDERWNDIFRNEMHNFPLEGHHDDCVDAMSLAHYFLKTGLFTKFGLEKEKQPRKLPSKHERWRNAL